MSRYDLPVDDLLAVLTDCDNNLARAIKRLSKRPASNSLSSWLQSTSSNAVDRPKKRKKTKSAATADPSLRTVNDVLKASPASAPTASTSALLPPLLLGTPALVAQHAPCTLMNDILPPTLAARLYLELLNESKTWQRNKWWLFERQVESVRLSYPVPLTILSLTRKCRENSLTRQRSTSTPQPPPTTSKPLATGTTANPCPSSTTPPPCSTLNATSNPSSTAS